MVKEVLEELFPPDVPRIVRWRMIMALAMGFMVFHVAWACGMLPGTAGFALANEVDAKISAAAEPIYRRLDDISKKLETSEQIQRRLLVGQLAAQLRDLHRLKCSTADDHVRMRMDRDIEDAQQEYRVLSNERYPLPACKDL